MSVYANSAIDKVVAIDDAHASLVTSLVACRKPVSVLELGFGDQHVGRGDVELVVGQVDRQVREVVAQGDPHRPLGLQPLHRGAGHGLFEASAAPVVPAPVEARFKLT